MNVVIVANGVVRSLARYRALIEEAGLVVAADGGARALLEAGLRPDIVLGDLDSLPPQDRQAWQASGGETLLFPVDKDETDLELALRYARDHGAAQAIILGALGGRPDHALGNVLLLASPLCQDVMVSIVDASTRIVAVRKKEVVLDGQEGDLLSLVPLTARAEGIITRGLRYPLHGETLDLGTTRGISNVFTAAQASVSLQSGILLAIHTWPGERSIRWP